MLEGSMHVKMEDREKEVQAGDICLLNSREIHSFRSTKNKSLVLQVPEIFLEKYIPDYAQMRLHIDPNPKRQTEITKLEWLKKVSGYNRLIQNICVKIG